MRDDIQYQAGEELTFDYTDDQERVIWGQFFEFGDAIVVRLGRDLTEGELHRNMGRGGPWGWGAFTTEWIESIAEQVESLFDGRVLYRGVRQAFPSQPGSQADAGGSYPSWTAY